MKEGWEYKKIKEVANVFAGQSAPQGDSNYCQKGIPFVKAGNLSELINGKPENSIQNVSEQVAKSHKLKLYKAGSVLFAKSGMSCMKGFVYTLKNDCYVVSHLAILSPKAINSHYLNYYLCFYKPYTLINDAAYPTISLKDIEKLEIPVPTNNEQQSIVDYLDSAFAKIDTMKANAEKALNEAKALFQASLKEMLEPKEGWEGKTLGVVCAITSLLVNPDEDQYKKLLHVGGANIISESGELVNLKTSEEEKLISGKFLFDSEDVLYNKIRPYLKKVARPDFSGLCSADMYPLKHKDSITRDFLYYVLITKDFTDYAILNSGRAGMPKVNRQALFAYSFSLPSLNEQRKIASALDSLKSKLDQLQENFDKISQECDALKQAILRHVFE